MSESHSCQGIDVCMLAVVKEVNIRKFLFVCLFVFRIGGGGGGGSGG